MVRFQAGEIVFAPSIEFKSGNLTLEMREGLRRPAMLGVIDSIKTSAGSPEGWWGDEFEYGVKVTSPPSAAGRIFFFDERDLRIPTEDDLKAAVLEAVTDAPIED